MMAGISFKMNYIGSRPDPAGEATETKPSGSYPNTEPRAAVTCPGGPWIDSTRGDASVVKADNGAQAFMMSLGENGDG